MRRVSDSALWTLCLHHLVPLETSRDDLGNVCYTFHSMLEGEVNGSGAGGLVIKSGS